jgi:hypothetical protein
MRLMMRTTTATTSRRWIKLPATWKAKPRIHKIKRIAKIVQSMYSPGQEIPAQGEKLGKRRELSLSELRAVFLQLAV